MDGNCLEYHYYLGGSSGIVSHLLEAVGTFLLKWSRWLVWFPWKQGLSCAVSAGHTAHQCPNKDRPNTSNAVYCTDQRLAETSDCMTATFSAQWLVWLHDLQTLWLVTIYRYLQCAGAEQVVNSPVHCLQCWGCTGGNRRWSIRSN